MGYTNSQGWKEVYPNNVLFRNSDIILAQVRDIDDAEYDEEVA